MRRRTSQGNMQQAVKRQQTQQADLTVNLLLEQLPSRIQIDLISSFKPGAARGQLQQMKTPRAANFVTVCAGPRFVLPA